MATPLTVAAALRAATAALATSPSARLDAELLLAHCTECSRTQLFMHGERTLSPDVRARFEALCAERAAGVPLAYLTGRAEFWSLEFDVTPDVLIPRADTELAVETVLALWPSSLPARVIDLGTGSGAIAAALAHERAEFIVTASDRSAAALRVAAANFTRLGLARIGLLRGAWLAAVADSCVDIIVANPPYVAAGDIIGHGVGHEPASALYAADSGLAELACIIADAPRCLRMPGLIVLEHGNTQGAAVRAMLGRAGFVEVETRRDLAGHERVSFGWHRFA